MPLLLVLLFGQRPAPVHWRLGQEAATHRVCGRTSLSQSHRSGGDWLASVAQRSLPQRNRALFFYCFHGEVGGYCFKFYLFDQPFVDVVVASHVAGNDFEKIVVLAADTEEINDFRNG